MRDLDLDARAAEAERSVTALFGGRLLGLPGTHLARVEHPARGRADAHWNYWWQAHYLDCVVDAGLRALRLGDVEDAAERARRGDRLLATIRLRNVGRFPNAFYDDMAWLVLAAGRLAVLQASLGRARPGSPAPGVRAGPHGAAALGRDRRPRRRRLLEHPPRLQERPRQRTGRPAPGPDRRPRRRTVARRVDVCAAVRPGVGSLPRRGTRGRRPGGRRSATSTPTTRGRCSAS